MSAHLDMNTKGRASAFSSTDASHLARVELTVEVTAALWEENCMAIAKRTDAIETRALAAKGTE